MYRWDPDSNSFRYQESPDHSSGNHDWMKYLSPDYYLDRPTTEDQFNDQLTMDVILGGRISEWHRNQELQTKNANTRGIYGIDFSKVKYPYLSTVYSGGTSSNPSIVGGFLQISKTLTRLYR